MIRRHLSEKLKEAASQYPVVTLTGPRQSGKTTLVKNSFPGYRYISLEDTDERTYALEDPRGFLAQCKNGVILDEVQRVPDLFSYIQTIVDNRDTAGQFILSGSQNFLLHSGISQSLAGRTCILHLMPFTKRELESKAPLAVDTLDPGEEPGSSPGLFKMMFAGFYPRIHDKKLNVQEWLADYFQTYVQRDVRTILSIGDIDTFTRFVKLCAGRVGQLFNASSLAADCGVSHSTVQRWLSILESSFIVFRLMPHHQNFSKRLIKSAKLYFIDTGLLCYLLRLKEPDDLRLSPYRGAVFENFCIAEFLKSAYHQKREPGIFFWRDSTGHEIDLLIEQGERLMPFEIKSGETFNADFIDGLKYWLQLAEGKDEDASVLYGGERRRVFKGIGVLPWRVL